MKPTPLTKEQKKQLAHDVKVSLCKFIPSAVLEDEGFMDVILPEYWPQGECYPQSVKTALDSFEDEDKFDEASNWVEHVAYGWIDRMLIAITDHPEEFIKWVESMPLVHPKQKEKG